MSRSRAFKTRRKGGEPSVAVDVETHTHRFTIAEITGHTENVPIITYVDRVSDDNRRRYHEEFPIEQLSPVKRQRVAERTGAVASASLRATTSTQDDLVGPSCYQMGLDEDEDPFGPVPDTEPRKKQVVKPSVRVFSFHRFSLFIF